MKRSSFFDRPLLMLKKTDKTKQLIKDAESINQRLNDLEKNLYELSRASVELQKETGKALKQVIKSLDKRLVQQQISIDESLDQVLKNLSSSVQAFTQFNSSNSKQISAATSSVNSISADLTGIRDFLDKSTAQNRRFQEGYDFQILKSFVKQIVSIINDLESQKNKTEDLDAKETLEYAYDDLVELLDRNNIKQIVPEVNASYDDDKLKYWEVVEEKISTKNAELHGCVAEINRIGYIYAFNNDQQRVIIPAQVKLYAIENNDNSQPSNSNAQLDSNKEEELPNADNDELSSPSKNSNVSIEVTHEKSPKKPLKEIIVAIILLMIISVAFINKCSKTEEIDVAKDAKTEITKDEKADQSEDDKEKKSLKK